MTEINQSAWDEIWLRFYDRSVTLGLTPNRSAARADDEMAVRYGQRPKGEAS